MRLKTKMFIWATIVLCVSLSVSGYLLISAAFTYSMNREQEQAVNQYQFIKFALESKMITQKTNWKQKNELSDVLKNGVNLDKTYVAIFNEVKEVMNTTFPTDFDYGVADSVQENSILIEVAPYQDKYFMKLCGIMNEGGNPRYLQLAMDISPIIEDREELEKVFFVTYAIVFITASVLVYVFSMVITRPIKQLTCSAQIISRGNYKERVDVHTKDEIGELSQNFNRMAEEIEKKIDELHFAVLQKENFVANFAHELKTPLTSIIGYSDMIYQKNLSREEVKDAAECILGEGLRLEALSLKLMDLIVLDKQEFFLEYLNVDDLFRNLNETTAPLFHKMGAEISLDIEPAYVKVEFDLLKTLLLNLIDNALKANATKIHLIGQWIDGKYLIKIVDNGFGIPEEDLARIMEAFYVVDKSRSRMHHGVGLGLALSERIAFIHGTTLTITSEENVGTTVSFYLVAEEDES